MSRVLTISRTSPQVKSGSGFIMNQFINFFNQREMFFLSENNAEIKLKSNRVHYVNSSMISLKRGNRFFGWHRWLLLPKLIKVIGLVANSKKCKSILCVYPDEIYLIAAFYAAKKLQIPFYPYFHNLYYENKKGLSKIIARKVQKKIFAYSPFVYIVSKGMLNELSTLYPNVDFRVLTHSLPSHKNYIKSYKSKFNYKNSNNKINVTFLGNINNSNIDALRYTINTLENQKDIMINLITKVPNSFLQKNRLLKNNVCIKNNIEDQDILNELNNSNFLLLPHGFKGPLSKPEYRSVFPTKTLHYLQSNTPILALLPSDSYLNKFLIENQCAFCITKKKDEELISIFNDLMHDKAIISKKVKNANKVAKKFLVDSVLIRVKNEILFNNDSLIS